MTHLTRKRLSSRSMSSHCHQKFCCNSPVRRQALSLADAIATFLSHLQASGHAKSTIVCYRGCLYRMAKAFGKVSADEVSIEDLEGDLVCQKRDSQLTEVTLNKIRSIYRSFFQWLLETGKIPGNPARHLSLARTSSLSTLPISMPEVTALLDTVRGSGYPHAQRDELLFAVYAFTGIRRSEALCLRVRDYDVIARELQIVGAKGGISRRLPVINLLAELFDRHLGQNDEGIKYVFAGKGVQRHLSARQAESRFDFWKRLSGIRSSLTIHSFRAGFATIMYRTTGNIWLVARALGHKNIASTRRYIESDATEIRQAIEIAFSSCLMVQGEATYRGGISLEGLRDIAC